MSIHGLNRVLDMLEVSREIRGGVFTTCGKNTQVILSGLRDESQSPTLNFGSYHLYFSISVYRCLKLYISI